METKQYHALVERNLDLVDRVIRGRFKGAKFWRPIGLTGTTRNPATKWVEVGRDEIRADCILKLMQAEKSYKPDQDFRKFAAVVIANHIRDLMRAWKRGRSMAADREDVDLDQRRDLEQAFKDLSAMDGETAVSVDNDTYLSSWFQYLAEQYPKVKILVDGYECEENDIQPDPRGDEARAMSAVADQLRPHLSGTALALLDQLLVMGELPPGHGTWKRLEDRYGLRADTARKAWSRAMERISEKM